MDGVFEYATPFTPQRFDSRGYIATTFNPPLEDISPNSQNVYFEVVFKNPGKDFTTNYTSDFMRLHVRLHPSGHELESSFFDVHATILPSGDMKCVYALPFVYLGDKENIGWLSNQISDLYMYIRGYEEVCEYATLTNFTFVPNIPYTPFDARRFWTGFQGCRELLS